VNRVAIFTLVAMVVLFSNAGILFAAADSNSAAQTKSITPVKAEKPKVTVKKNVKSDANAPAEPNKIGPKVDPNVIKAKWQKELDASIERLEQSTLDETKEWTQRSAENRIGRLKSLDKQVTEQFDLIRKIAAEEDALRTVETINRILESRKDRLEKLIESIKEDVKKEERRKELQEKRDQQRKEREDRDRRR